MRRRSRQIPCFTNFEVENVQVTKKVLKIKIIKEDSSTDCPRADPAEKGSTEICMAFNKQRGLHPPYPKEPKEEELR